MKTINRLWALALAAIMLVSLLGGGLAVTRAEAAPGTGVSETYPEATELLTALGVMDNSAKAWTDAITPEEANSIIKTAFFDAPLNPYNWGYTETIPAGATVTGGQFLHSANSGLGWGLADSVMIAYSRLTRGIEGYDASAALTREQAAQLLVNCMKSTAGYNSTEIRGVMMGVNYVKTGADEMGRPSYQWVKTSDGSALTASYQDTPIAVLEGGSTWGQMAEAVGLTQEVVSTLLNSGRWSERMFNNAVYMEGAAPDGYTCFWTDPVNNPGYGTAYLAKGWTLAIYDAYKPVGAPLDGNTFTSRAYDVIVFSDLIAQVKTIDGAKRLGMYGERHGEPYGWWDVSDYLPAISSTADGIYVMHWSSVYSRVNDLTAADTLGGKLTAFDLNGGTAAVDGASKALSDRFNYGRALMTDDNLNKYFVFYLDSFGNILGAELCQHTMSAWTLKDASVHARTCGDCGFEETEAHSTELRDYKAPTVSEPGYTGDTYCTVCGGLVASGSPIPVSDCEHEAGEPVRENEISATCDDPGSYDAVTYCKNCSIKLTSEHVVVPAKGHAWKETERVDATDTKGGHVSYVCENDSSHTKTEELPAKLAGKTNYKEAVALSKALGLDGGNDIWNTPLTGAEANQLLQTLYDGPGFVDAWAPGFAPGATVTGEQFISKALVTIGWNYGNDPLFGAYNNLEKGLGEDYDPTQPLTRDQGMQMFLNALKTTPTYNIETYKHQDPGINLTLVKTGEDAEHRPSYKWQQNGADLTDSFADTPVARVRGGCPWNTILNAVHYITDDGIAPAQFRWSEEGGAFTDFVPKRHSDDTTPFKDKEWILDVYFDYSTPHNGYEFSIIAYKSDEVLPGEEKPDTYYPEAVELMSALGWMDGDNKDWKQPITGAEANRVLQALYDGPGFVASWAPGFDPNEEITGFEFTGKALVTIGWNYNNDALFTAYNHLEKGLKPWHYGCYMTLTREQAAQIALNTLKAMPTYNLATLKANDPGIGLTLVKTGTDWRGRPYYKWQRNGADVTDSYRDMPVTTSQGGIIWSDILTTVGDAGEINFEQLFRISESGGAYSDYIGRQHPNYEVFKTEDWAVEVFLDYRASDTTYAYSVITYEGLVDNPDTGDETEPALFALLALFAAAAMAAVLVIGRKKKVYSA